VRRRKLREEYSVLWIVTAIGLLLLAWQYRLLTVFQQLFGIVEPQFALFFGALLFLVLIALQFSVRLSKLTYRNKFLTQRVALLHQEIEELRSRVDPDAASDAREEEP
jgi:cell division protein FtsB